MGKSFVIFAVFVLVACAAPAPVFEPHGKLIFVDFFAVN